MAVPPSANQIVQLRNVVQTGKPRSDVNKPNHNSLLVLFERWSLAKSSGGIYIR